MYYVNLDNSLDDGQGSSLRSSLDSNFNSRHGITVFPIFPLNHPVAVVLS